MSQKGTGGTSTAESKGILQRFSNYVDQHLFAIRFGVVSVGICGFAIVSYRLRVFTKFTKAADIPDWFYHRHVNLYGQLKGIDTVTTNSKQETILHVSHMPILHLKLKSSMIGSGEHKHMRIKLWGIRNDSAVEFTRFLTDFFANNTRGRRGVTVCYTLMQKPADIHGDDTLQVLCFVRRNWRPLYTCLNKVALTKGSARFDSNMQTQLDGVPAQDSQPVDRFITRWHTRLANAQYTAMKRGVGLWHDASKQSFVSTVLRKLGSSIVRLFRRD